MVWSCKRRETFEIVYFSLMEDCDEEESGCGPQESEDQSRTEEEDVRTRIIVPCVVIRVLTVVVIVNRSQRNAHKFGISK